MTWPDYGVWAQVGFGALAVAALVAVLFAWLRRRAHTPGLRYPTRHRAQGVAPGWRARLVRLPFALRVAALALLLIAATRPQLTEEETAEVEGIDIVVALDLSGSMATVDISDEDLVKLQNAGREPKDRFTAAVEVLTDFIESRRYDRVSLVVFGKEAFLQFPLTLDYGVMLGILERMKLGDVDGSATVIGNALAMSLARLAESEAKSKVVILITDGEDNGSNVSPVEMAKEAAKRGVKVFPILVGSDDQSRQPTEMVDVFTGHRVYKAVDNKVNPALLEEIAKVTEGTFYRSTDEQALKRDFRSILDEFEKSRLVDYAAAERTEMFVWFLVPGLLLLLLEVLLGQTVLRRFP
ncbi:MAG: VWA domain-containing protein [Myxococcales bacterium]|nr:VWA domain-containing protein [Myxococcales bacterium]